MPNHYLSCITIRQHSSISIITEREQGPTGEILEPETLCVMVSVSSRIILLGMRITQTIKFNNSRGTIANHDESRMIRSAANPCAIEIKVISM